MVANPGNQTLIIFTDLDGTLLDHDTYSFEPARPALERLRTLNIPLILASSKTAAEIIPLRDALGFSHCEAIVENGSGILEPGPPGEADQGTYPAIRDVLETLPPGLRDRFQGFGDWSIEEICRHTGLSADDAARAKQRRFSEPGLWSGTEADRAAFLSTINEKGLIATQGGRFLTLSFGGNKAERMDEIASRHTGPMGKPFMVALGDAENDIAMIRRADLGVIIPNPGHRALARLDEEETGKIVRARAAGPAGWTEIIMPLLNRAERT